MLRQYFTLRAVAKECESLRDLMITEVWVQEQRSLVFRCEKDATELFLESSFDTRTGFICLRSTYARAKNNAADVFSFLIGSVIKSVSCAPNDRSIELTTNDAKIYFNFFSGGEANVIVCNNDGYIVDALRRDAVKVGDEYVRTSPSTKQLTDFPPETSIRKAVASCNLLLGTIYADEVLAQCAIDGSRLCSTISHQEFSALFSKGMELREQCINATNYYLCVNEQGERVCSCIPLRAYPTIEKQSHSISEILRIRIADNFKRLVFTTLLHQANSALLREQTKLEKSIAMMMDNDSAHQKREMHKHWADLLLSQPNVQRKVGESIEVVDWEGTLQKIPLDASKTIAENAAKFYDSVRRSAESTKVKEQRLPIYKKRLEKVYEVLSTINQSTTADEIRSAFALIFPTKELGSQVHKKKKVEARQPFRVFNLDGDWKLYVGKSSQSNDELTMQFAKPQDYWFHARGVSGSHAVLPVRGKHNPPLHILEQACAIAAYYSQSRNGTFVPVIYTKKKHVRKPKRANPGAVVVEREEVLLVEPKLAVKEEGES